MLPLAMNNLAAEDLRIGMVGLDTSHVVAFTQLLNNASDPNHIAGAKVVAGFKGGSPDVESSATRVEGYTKELAEKYGVKIVGTVEELCTMVDCVMIQSIDGRPHLEQARPAIKAGKPLFIDKPFAASLKDVIEIFRLAKEAGVPVFTSSAYRYYDSMIEVEKKPIGELRAAISYGPAHLEPHHPDLFWYGIHPVEALFTAMGTGCESVSRIATENTDVVAGLWSGGRTGTLIGLREIATPHKVVLFGTKAAAEQQNGSDSYAPLVREIVKFFQTKKSPISPEETIQIYAFMEAADESKRHNGAPVRLDDVMKKAGGPAKSDSK